MKSSPRLVAGVGASCLVAIAAIVYAQFGPLPFDAPVRYVSALPSAGWFPGQEVRIISGNPPSVVSWVWDATDNDWERTDLKAGFEDAAVFDGAVTITGAAVLSSTVQFQGSVSANGNSTLGSNDVDNITINGPMTSNVILETFDRQAWHAVEEDYTAAVVTDIGENYLILPGSQFGMFWYSFEQAFAGTLTPFSVAGELDLSSFIDNVTTDGVDFTFGGDPVTAIYYDEDNSNNTYCEVSITLATIANIDELYFGWRLNEARTAIDGNDISTANTYAVFRVPDNAGDVDIETELNGGGTLNDDSGQTWADAGTNILRVSLLADSVTFAYNGSAVTQTNAVLNLDAADRMVCILGIQNSAVGATAGAVLNYVEIGRTQ